MKRLAIALGAVALVVVLVIGLSQAGGGGSGGGKSAGAAKITGGPPRLAKLHAQANQLLPGGPEAYKRQLAGLRGYPIVVNKWASWCAPCRAEFPDFQKMSEKYGKRVAFLGVNSNDNRGDALKFLKSYPLSYPSYEDGNNEIAQVFNGVLAFPTTVFYDSKGKVAFLHQGQYPNAAALEKDIQRYAIQ
jgi:thiol-disulfide isomerase/thioredoxin